MRWHVILPSALNMTGLGVSAFLADSQTSRVRSTLPRADTNFDLCMIANDSLLAAMAVRLDRPELQYLQSGTGGGGGGTSVFTLVDPETGSKFFGKTAPLSSRGGPMLLGEKSSLQTMYDTQTLRVPKPLAYGEGGDDSSAFLIVEHLEMTPRTPVGAMYQLGQQLAKLHRESSQNQARYGFPIGNTIGSTPQSNTWNDDWSDFWFENRLDPMLKRTRNVGWTETRINKLKEKIRDILCDHKPIPSLLHGDLWGGNHGFLQSNEGDDGVQPVVFDPASYYGDRETDIAMTRCFMTFDKSFYEGYQDEWPLDEEYKSRQDVYNLYHILNHAVLFGGEYRSQAKSMMDDILRQ